MKKLFLGMGGIILFICLILAIVPFLIPNEVYRSQIEKQAETALGRDITLEGDVGLTLFPTLSASLGNFQIDNPEGYQSPHLIKAGGMRANIKWMPLFSGRVEIGAFTLQDGMITLERRADGQTNWNFHTTRTQTQTNDLETEDKASRTEVSAGISRFHLENITIRYSDKLDSINLEINALNLTGSMPATNQPLQFEGSGELHNNAIGFNVKLDNIDALIATQSVNLASSVTLGEASFDWKGTITLSDPFTFDGVFMGDLDNLADLANRLKVLTHGYVPENLPDLAPLGGLTFQTKLRGKPDAVTLEDAELVLAGAAISANAQGSARYTNDGLNYDMELALNTPASFKLINIFAPDLLNTDNLQNALKHMEMKAQLRGSDNHFNAMFEKFVQTGDGVNINWAGSINLPDLNAAPDLSGELDADISQIGRFLAFFTALGLPADLQDLLGTASFKGNVTGNILELTLQDVRLAHNSAALDLRFDGSAKLGSNGTLNGALRTETNQLPAWLKIMKMEDALPGIMRLTLSSQTSGTFNMLNIDSYELSLEEINLSGSGALSLQSIRPKLSGKVESNALNLTRFLGKGADSSQQTNTTAWGETPFEVEGLRGVDLDLDLDLTAPQIDISDTRLTNVVSRVELDDGRLTTRIEKASAFGGEWSGNLIVNARTRQPHLSYKLQANGVQAADFLSTLVSVDRFTGFGSFDLSGNTSGNNLKALIANMDGTTIANLSDGTIKGLNVAQLFRSRESLQAALLAGLLNGMDFSSVLAPEAETDFTKLRAHMNIKKGIATLSPFQFDNPFLNALADGSINLTEQTLDLRLIPKIDDSGRGQGSALSLNGEPVPVRIVGSWFAPSLVPDFAFIRQNLQKDLRTRVIEKVAPQLNEQPEVRRLIDGVLREQSSTSNTDTNTSAARQANETSAPTIETIVETPEQAITSLFGGIVRRELERQIVQDGNQENSE